MNFVDKLLKAAMKEQWAKSDFDCDLPVPRMSHQQRLRQTVVNKLENVNQLEKKQQGKKQDEDEHLQKT